MNSFSKKTNVSGVAVLKNIAWGKEFLNLYSLTNGETGSFTIQTEMTSPDSGIEFITIQNQKADTCKEEALFKNNQEGQGIYSGVRTTCYPTEDQILSVSCYWL
ncbi:MAG: hypothetical protein JST80_10320 [Bdellovibrionales bacterium]|nr:hypothetical protein [Bdellovibrionales bacterium]